MTNLNWDLLCEERNAWVAHNFPSTVKTTESCLGVIEEVGELAHADLKERQNIRGTAEEHQATAKDSIGDIIVYLLGPIATVGVRMEDALFMAGRRWRLNQHDSRDRHIGMLAKLAGELLDDYAGWIEDGRRTVGLEMGCGGIAHFAHLYCDDRGWDFDAIVTETWNGVKKRDWIKYPDTGLPPNTDRHMIEQDTGGTLGEA